MNESISAQTHIRPSQFTSAILYISILLLGVVAGLALIYSLQPPPPPSDLLLYDISIFTSDQPIDDFTPRIQMLQQSNATRALRLKRRGRPVGNIQFSIEPKSSTRFTLLLHNRNITEANLLTHLQCKLRGDPIHDRIHTQLMIGTQSLKIGAQCTSATHQFELHDGEYRVVEVFLSEKAPRQWCYAIIKVSKS